MLFYTEIIDIFWSSSGHGCSAATHFPLMRSSGVIGNKPCIHIGLQFLHTRIQLPTKTHLIKLLQHGLVKLLAHAVGLLDIFYSQIQLIIVRFHLAAILRAPVGKYPQQGELMLCKEGQDPVVEQISRSNRGFRRIEFGKAHPGIDVHKALLVDSANPLESTRIKAILRALVAGMRGFDLT